MKVSKTLCCGPNPQLPAKGRVPNVGIGYGLQNHINVSPILTSISKILQDG